MVAFVSNQWFDYPVTQSHLTDDGEDIGTPSGTPVFFPDKTKIEDTSWHDYGGQVVGDVQGSGWSEYFIHLRDITVQPGRTYPAGTVIGHTGGGVGDNLLHNGHVQPAQSQSWYDGHSSGPHTEFGIFRGEDMATVNKAWGNKSAQKDPGPLVKHLSQVRGAGIGSGGDGLSFLGIGSNSTTLASDFSGGVDPTGIASAITGLGGSIGTSAAKAQADIAKGAKRAGFFLVGGMVLVAGALILVLPAARDAIVQGAEAATTVGTARQALRTPPRTQPPAPAPAPAVHVHAVTQPAPAPVVHIHPVNQQAPQVGAPVRAPIANRLHGHAGAARAALPPVVPAQRGGPTSGPLSNVKRVP